LTATDGVFFVFLGAAKGPNDCYIEFWRGACDRLHHWKFRRALAGFLYSAVKETPPRRRPRVGFFFAARLKKSPFAKRGIKDDYDAAVRAEERRKKATK
jgi:hypothetical protein